MIRDICGNEIRAGHMVHIWWESPDGSNGDHICTVVRTRGRGIKFVTDDGHTLNTEELVEKGANFAIQGSVMQAKIDKKREREARSGREIGTDELDMIGKLRELGWYGTIYKKAMNQSTFRIEMPEMIEQ